MARGGQPPGNGTPAADPATIREAVAVLLDRASDASHGRAGLRKDGTRRVAGGPTSKRQRVHTPGMASELETELRLRRPRSRPFVLRNVRGTMDKFVWTGRETTNDVAVLHVGGVRAVHVLEPGTGDGTVRTVRTSHEIKDRLFRKVVRLDREDAALHSSGLVMSVATETETVPCNTLPVELVRVRRRTSYWSGAWRFDVTIINEGVTLDTARGSAPRVEVEAECVDRTIARQESELSQLVTVVRAILVS